jgi:hypothetical protein
MGRRLSSGASDFLLGFISIWIVSLAVHPGVVVEAACPSLLNNGWTVNGIVYYQATGFTAQEMNQIGGAGAIGNWTYYNTNTFIWNCSNVEFRAAPPTGQFTITTSNGKHPTKPSAAAVTGMNLTSGIVTSATTTFYWGAMKSNGVPVWVRDNSALYYSFIKKAMLHEVGHTMGLDDVTSPVAGQSVMNGIVGIMDSSNNMPSEVQTCDNSSVSSILQYANNCGIAGGGENAPRTLNLLRTARLCVVAGALIHNVFAKQKALC